MCYDLLMSQAVAALPSHRIPSHRPSFITSHRGSAAAHACICTTYTPQGRAGTVRVHLRPGRPAGGSWPAAAIHMEKFYCSCKLRGLSLSAGRLVELVPLAARFGRRRFPHPPAASPLSLQQAFLVFQAFYGKSGGFTVSIGVQQAGSRRRSRRPPPPQSCWRSSAAAAMRLSGSGPARKRPMISHESLRSHSGRPVLVGSL